MLRPLRKTSTIVYVSWDTSDATTLFAENFLARATDSLDVSLDLANNLRTRNKDENTYSDARELADGGIVSLTSIQIDDKQVLDGLRRKLRLVRVRPKQWRLRVQLEGDHWFAVRPEVPHHATDTLLLHVVSVLEGAMPEPPAVNSSVVVIPFACTHCRVRLEVDCQHTTGFSVMNSYRIDCPKCGNENDRQLPGEVLDVRVAGEDGDAEHQG